MAKRYTTRTHFQDRSRRNKKRAYIRIKNHITRAAPVLGGKFTTNTYMHGDNGWLDAHFLGTKPPIFYSLMLQTTLCEYKKLVRSRAWELSDELAPDWELPLFDGSVKDPTTGHYVSRRREPVRYLELENMTRLDWCEAQHQKIADSGDIQVFENWTLQHNYHHGIGLHATIAPVLTIEAVNAFIDRFLITEANFMDATPHTYRYEQVPHWGLGANALMEPWQWDAARRPQAVEDETATPEVAIGLPALPKESQNEDVSGD
jgi:hypothetical protein